MISRLSVPLRFPFAADVSTESIAKHAILAENPAGKFRVMHPVDILQGRLENVHGLAEKRDEHGLAQLRLAIAMVREFLADIAARETASAERPDRPVALRHLRRIETLALSEAGRKVAKRYHVHVADAIDPAPLSHIKSFVTKKLPQLLGLMSAEWQARVAATLD